MPDRSLLDHVTIATVDFAASLAFYDAALAALGLVRLQELVDEEEDAPEVEAVGWGSPGGTAQMWLVAATPPTTGAHVRLLAYSRVDVETFHAAGVAAGGTGQAEPRRWTVYRRGEFGAIVADPAGNLIEAVAAE